jgi:hypothetical protein
MTSTFQNHVTLLKRRVGMYVMGGTYGEVCAFIDGLDLGSGQEIMMDFRTWLIARGTARPELSWWFLVLSELYPGDQVPNVETFSRSDSDAAIARLFELLETFLNERSGGY